MELLKSKITAHFGHNCRRGHGLTFEFTSELPVESEFITSSLNTASSKKYTLLYTLLYIYTHINLSNLIPNPNPVL